MATISLDIPDAALPRVVAALCARGHWTAELGIAKSPFAKKVLAEWLKDEVRRYERREAEAAAIAAVPDPTPVDVT